VQGLNVSTHNIYLPPGAGTEPPGVPYKRYIEEGNLRSGASMSLRGEVRNYRLLLRDEAALTSRVPLVRTAQPFHQVPIYKHLTPTD